MLLPVAAGAVQLVIAGAGAAAPGDVELVASGPSPSTTVLVGSRLRVTGGGSTTAPVSDVRVEVAPSGTASWQFLGMLPGSSDGTSWSTLGALDASSLAAGTYAVRAVALSVSGAPVDTSTPSPIQVVHATTAPSGVSATVSGSNVLVSWTPANTLPVTFNVYRQDAPGAGYVEVASGLTSTGYSDGHLPGAASVTYTVTASDQVGNQSGFAPASGPVSTPATWGQAAPSIAILSPTLTEAEGLLPGITRITADIGSGRGRERVTGCQRASHEASVRFAEWPTCPSPSRNARGGGCGCRPCARPCSAPGSRQRSRRCSRGSPQPAATGFISILVATCTIAGSMQPGAKNSQ